MRILFGEFALDSSSRQLLRRGHALHLEPKAFELLLLLLEARPAAVSKRRIGDRVWPGTFVSEAGLSGLVSQLRRALGDGRKEALFIRTVHGFGYAFAGDATEDALAPDAQTLHRVVWERRVIPLLPGLNLIGRDEEAVVRIEAPGVSRRHARIVVTESQAMLEDLGSRNGTYHQECRLHEAVRLQDGDHFRVGRQLLTYRCVPLGRTTEAEANR